MQHATMDVKMSLEDGRKKIAALGIPSIETEDVEQPAVNGDVWERDDEMAAAVNQFERFVAERREQGIEIANLPQKLSLVNEIDPTATPRLVTRPEQRRVVKLAYDKSREILGSESTAGTEGRNLKRVVLAVRGSPGIGKSWSALLYLQHLLNEKERPIIFESGQLHNDRHVRLFVVNPTKKSWVAYKLKVKGVPSKWTQFPGKDVIIDPAQFASSEDPKASALLACLGHIFIPVSPDNLHLGPTHKIAKRIQLVLGPWFFKEIMVAWPYMYYRKPPEEDHEVQEYFAMEKLVKERYNLFGGLPRYLLDDSKAHDRRTDMTTDKATKHQELLFSALQDAKIDDRKKVVTLFFTLYPGVNDDGQDDPDIKYSTVEFVSRGALTAAGHVIFHQLTKNTLWRTRSDASSVGLAFEAVCLMFLHMGTKGMNEMGIEMHCRELLKGGGTKTAQLSLNHCPYATNNATNTGSHELVPVVEAADETEFFKSVLDSGDQLDIEDSDGCVKITSNAPVSFPPPGLANVDGMSGLRLSYQMTLRKSHPPLGLQYIHQREELGVGIEKESVIVFTVPHYNFENGWTNYQHFMWKGEGQSDGDPPSNDSPPNKKKRRRGTSSTHHATAGTAATRKINETQKSSARASLRQFVLAFTLNAAATANLVSAPQYADESDKEEQDEAEAERRTRRRQ